ncbi:acetoin utilization protein AcuC [Arthrobacter glacialis]|uniref:Acetoin utilization protein AcuC n=2 Tax=Arthrobacter glacialis TaxID=1664 RepID=A0A2S4A1X9_ARTGL|nr:acetoin utilization protein AcuC [Arthrobacter glacialis]POH61078.1 acetoin utilization protein AcuC [Arthrobacter glacialis]POH75212.1 acetoin utilization protein AcuC [Arthrobacter glacialis]
MSAYNFGPHHPMSPARLDLTASLARELGIFELPQVDVVESYVAGDDQLATVHDRDYIAAVRRVGDDPTLSDPDRGLGTEDDPVFVGIHEASARLAGGSLLAASALISGAVPRAVNFGGGMHHAFAGKASGFCIYNDTALAIVKLLESGVSKVAYIDIDAHHGDGTERIFWDDPRVLTISLHESGVTLFPGTGFANDLGGPLAEGTAVNVALPAGTSDAGWLRAFHAVVPQLVEAFAPEVIVSQHGCDSHREDSLTHLNTSVDGQREAALSIAALADKMCGGRWIATGGGGYNIVGVVPRVWSHLMAIVAGKPVPLRTPVPETWRSHVAQKYGKVAPLFMGEDADTWWRSWEVGYNPSDALDRTVMATRKAVFPMYGLDPWFD